MGGSFRTSSPSPPATLRIQAAATTATESASTGYEEAPAVDASEFSNVETTFEDEQWLEEWNDEEPSPPPAESWAGSIPAATSDEVEPAAEEESSWQAPSIELPKRLAPAKPFHKEEPPSKRPFPRTSPAAAALADASVGESSQKRVALPLRLPPVASSVTDSHRQNTMSGSSHSSAGARFHPNLRHADDAYSPDSEPDSPARQPSVSSKSAWERRTGQAAWESNASYREDDAYRDYGTDASHRWEDDYRGDNNGSDASSSGPIPAAARHSGSIPAAPRKTTPLVARAAPSDHEWSGDVDAHGDNTEEDYGYEEAAAPPIAESFDEQLAPPEGEDGATPGEDSIAPDWCVW